MTGQDFGGNAVACSKGTNNFKRHCYFMFGAAVGVGLTILGGWLVSLGWLIGYGLSAGILYAFACGYLRVDRKGRS